MSRRAGSARRTAAALVAAVLVPVPALGADVRGGLPTAAGGQAADVLRVDLGTRHLDALSALSDETAAELTRLLERAGRCIEATGAFLPDAAHKLGATAPDEAAASHVRLMRACARDLEAGAVRTAATLDPDDPGIDLWPLARIDTVGTNDTYRHDYVVVIDLGGNDTYLNNAGGNLLDLRRGPDGSAAPTVGPARGCRNVAELAALATLEFRTDPECLPAAAVLLDASGNDTYGAFETPGTDPGDDAICTKDRLVRRIMTAGAGFAGAAVLRDEGGNDLYLGKTGAQGAGHVGGVGVLRDLAGNDTYRAIRNSQGFGLVEGEGELTDEEGNDSYGFYMPRPRDPKAAFQAPGSGGVIDDTGLCDNLVRQLQGTAQVGGAGILSDHAGDDLYVAAPEALQDFHMGVVLAHGSQAFGALGGYGILYDGAGRDAYLTGSGQPMPERGDGVTRGPSISSQGVVNTALFMDRSHDLKEEQR